MNTFIKWFIITLGLTSGSVIVAQSGFKHPRVADLEEKLTSDAFRYINARFPNMPVIVSVSIDPLRRASAEPGYGNGRGEALPFMDFGSLEVADEWDDPKRTLVELLNRVRSANVTVHLPLTATDEEVLELREALYSTLHLIPARDKIDFQRRNWTASRENFNWVLTGVTIGMVLLLLIGIFLISRTVTSRLVSGLKQSQRGGGAIMPAAPSTSQSGFSPGVGRPSGDVRFNDPIKLKEQIRLVVEILTASDNFPTLEDMIELDRKAKNDPALLSAVLAEFAPEMQDKLFTYSSDKGWLTAFVDVQEITYNAYEFVSRLAKKNRMSVDPKWEQLLIVLWRLGPELPNFLRDLSQDDAFSILANMPAQVSLPAGKKAFPGAWGVLLDPNFERPAIANSKISAIFENAITTRPLNSSSQLDRFRHEKELLEYLRFADVADEKEIYEAAHKDSMLHKMRPPFYKIFPQSEETLRNMVSSFAPNDWANALFNVQRSDRRKIESVMTDKQRFLLLEGLKNLDSAGADRQQIGIVRESIGAHLDEVLRRMESQPTISEENDTEEHDKQDGEPKNEDIEGNVNAAA